MTKPLPAPVLKAVRPEMFTAGGYLTPEGKRRIADAMSSRRLKLGALMREIGHPSLDASLGMALRRDTSIKNFEMRRAIEQWLHRQEESATPSIIAFAETLKEATLRSYLAIDLAPPSAGALSRRQAPLRQSIAFA